MVHAEVLEALVQAVTHVLLPRDTLGLLGIGANGELCRHNHLVTPGELRERASEVALARAVLVDDGRIEGVDSLGKGVRDDTTRVLVAERPGVLAG